MGAGEDNARAQIEATIRQALADWDVGDVMFADEHTEAAAAIAAALGDVRLVTCRECCERDPQGHYWCGECRGGS